MNDYELLANGLLIGADSPYQITSMDGLLTTPDLQRSDKAKLQRHGVFSSNRYYGKRTVTVTIQITETATISFDRAISDLKSALRFDQDEQAFSLQFPGVANGEPIRFNGTVDKVSLPQSRDFYYGIPEATIQIVCSDPRLYSDVLATDSLNLPIDTGGVTFAVEFNMEFSDLEASQSTIVLMNSGDFDAPVRFAVNGEISNPTIIHEESGRQLVLDGYSQTANDFLLINSADKSVLLNGTASRRQLLTSESSFFDLQPGTNTIRFDGVGDGTAILTASYRSAYI